MVTTASAAPDVDVLTTVVPIPGFGVIPVNAYVLHGPEPMLVDTGPMVEADGFMAALESVIDPTQLRWLWLSHTDFDHIGCLHRLLDAAPDLRVVTTFLGVGIMGLYAPLPLDRVHLLNPGQTLTVGQRTLRAFRPPAFDNPATTGFKDEASGIVFTSDCFGALLADVPPSAADLTDDELRTGQVFWATVDSPWLHRVEQGLLAEELDRITAMEPTVLLSSHLPPAPGAMVDRLVSSLATVPGADPFVGPDQPALEALLAEMMGATPA